MQEVVRKYRYILEPIGRESCANQTAVTLIITCVPRVFLVRAVLRFLYKAGKSVFFARFGGCRHRYIIIRRTTKGGGGHILSSERR